MQCDGLKFALELSWEARISSGTDGQDIRVMGASTSEILYIDVQPSAPVNRGHAVTLQQLLRCWEK